MKNISEYLTSSYLDEIKERDPKPFYKPTCAVISEKHGNCPEPVDWAVNIDDKEMFLCDRCYKNIRSNAYGIQFKILAEIKLPILEPVK